MRPQINKNLLVILAAALVALAAVSSAARIGARAGGWQPIKDLSDPTVKEIADFAVSEYNKQYKESLLLKKIVKGDSQVVAGTNYRLILAVANGGASQRYEAVVWDKPWEHYRNLTSFKPVS